MSSSYLESSIAKLSVLGAVVMAAASLCTSNPTGATTQNSISELDRGTGRLNFVAYRGTGRLQAADHRGTGRLESVAYRGTGRLNAFNYSNRNSFNYRGSKCGFSQGNLA
ncbi:MAG: hypothetical protein HC857_03575 [Synechococcales cyanobacterium RU_4_20]|nr:hypothetical protein [Synechococcales cyanobacterium RU_4_20]NJR67993.1 hypothetical protein [Synechococcales cyanobacterium CRU_2_2]